MLRALVEHRLYCTNRQAGYELYGGEGAGRWALYPLSRRPLNAVRAVAGHLGHKVHPENTTYDGATTVEYMPRGPYLHARVVLVR